MQVSISGQHISIGNSLQDYVKGRIQDVVHKYFAHAISTNIHFSKQHFHFICDIVVNDGTGRHIIIKSNSSSDDVYSAFDIALSKLQKQLRKYKSKLTDHHNRSKVSKGVEATKYIISPHEASEDDAYEIQASDSPTIIAEKSTEILTLTINEALMKMDLENFPALVFNNSNTGRINVIYYRKDGNISWIDCK